MDENGDIGGKFGKINFEGMDIGKFIDLCLKCETKEDVDDILGQYEKYCDSEEVARENLGYIFGYANEKNRKKLYLMFPVTHPVFGNHF
jgi:hypothetical protein